MEQQKEVEQLKKRIANLESQVQSQPRRSNAWRFIVTFIIVFIALLLSIGIFQFVAPAK